MIRFNSKSENFYQFSNLYQARFILDDISWRSVENYYQANKSNNQKVRLVIAELNPLKARLIGNNIILREGFENDKLSIMKEAIYAKFSQNEDLKELLLYTGDVELIEYAPWDRKGSYWGVNADGVGENHTGKILMDVRKSLGETK